MTATTVAATVKPISLAEMALVFNTLDHQAFVNARDNGVKITDDDIDNDLLVIAAGSLKAYTGDNEFLSSVRATAARNGRFTKPQARAVLNVLIAEFCPRQSTQYTDIHNAVKTLASVCDGANTLDGQGFNGTDAHFGHAMAERDTLSVKMAQACYKMLKKYSRQLAGFGIVYADLVNPSTGRTLAQDNAAKAADDAAREEAIADGMADHIDERRLHGDD